MEIKEAIGALCRRRDLSAEQAAGLFGRLMDGEATAVQMAALLVALKMKGETVAEIVGAARAMRARGTVVPLPDGPVVDTCGTGGDGAGTLNVSTVGALLVAACGVKVAKHGNRALSSRSGSADLLEALGVDVAAPLPVMERCLRLLGFGFFLAPAYHPATRHATPVRREIGVRTIFNLLGPLTNPAGVRRQVVGVYSATLCTPIALALGALGSERAMVVHGSGGLDELAPGGETEVAEWRGGEVIHYRLTPHHFGLGEADPGELLGGDPEFNAMRTRALLDGDHGAARNAALMTAAAALYVAGVAGLRDGAERAAAAIDTGAARDLLGQLIALSRRPLGEAGL